MGLSSDSPECIDPRHRGGSHCHAALGEDMLMYEGGGLPPCLALQPSHHSTHLPMPTPQLLPSPTLRVLKETLSMSF